MKMNLTLDVKHRKYDVTIMCLCIYYCVINSVKMDILFPFHGQGVFHLAPASGKYILK